MTLVVMLIILSRYTASQGGPYRKTDADSLSEDTVCVVVSAHTCLTTYSVNA